MLDGRRGSKPLIQTHEVPAARLVPGPQQGGRELEGVRGSEGVDAQEAKGLGAHRVTGFDGVGGVQHRRQRFEHLGGRG